MKKICLKSLSILVMKAVPKSILIGTQLLWSARSLRLLASGEVSTVGRNPGVEFIRVFCNHISSSQKSI